MSWIIAKQEFSLINFGVPQHDARRHQSFPPGHYRLADGVNPVSHQPIWVLADQPMLGATSKWWELEVEAGRMSWRQ